MTKKGLRFHATVKMVFDYQSVTKYTVAASRQLAPEVIMVMYMSPMDAPRRGWDLWRFASLIPSGCRLPPIHKVMGDHASRGSTPTGAFAVTWQRRGMKTEWMREGKRVEKKDKNEGVKWTRMKTRRMERKRETQ